MFVFVLMLAISITFILLHFSLGYLSRVYRHRLMPTKRLLLCIHIIMALTFALQLVPYTILLLHQLLGKQTIQQKVCTLEHHTLGHIIRPGRAIRHQS